MLTPAAREIPQPRMGEVVIRVAYAGVNRPDALQRAGLYNPPKGASDLPGLEASGEVVAVGEGVTDWSIGDKVCALLPGGGYAEYVTTPAAHCLPIPAGMAMEQAACLPENFFTVWSNVVQRGGLQAGERFLVHGGSSGIGTTAIQLGDNWVRGSLRLQGQTQNVEACLDLGPRSRSTTVMRISLTSCVSHGGADLILDMVGGSYIHRNLKASLMMVVWSRSRFCKARRLS